ncbi:TPA: hypothetical protein ACX6S2_003478 [Photobacterium damselae]
MNRDGLYLLIDNWIGIMVKISSEMLTILQVMKRANETGDNVHVEMDAGITLLISLAAELKEKAQAAHP